MAANSRTTCLGKVWHLVWKKDCQWSHLLSLAWGCNRPCCSELLL